MEKQWNYVEKDGNPKEAGTYWVTLIYPAWEFDGGKNGEEVGRGNIKIFCRS